MAATSPPPGNHHNGGIPFARSPSSKARTARLQNTPPQSSSFGAVLFVILLVLVIATYSLFTLSPASSTNLPAILQTFLQTHINAAIDACKAKPYAAMVAVGALAAAIVLQCYAPSSTPPPTHAQQHKSKAQQAQQQQEQKPKYQTLSPLRPGHVHSTSTATSSNSSSTPTQAVPSALPFTPPTPPPVADVPPGMWAAMPATSTWGSFARALASAVGTAAPALPLAAHAVSPAVPENPLAEKTYQPSARRAAPHATLTDAMAAGGSVAAVIAALQKLGCPPPGGDTEPWVDNLREWYAGTLLQAFLKKVDAVAERITSDPLYTELRTSPSTPVDQQLPAAVSAPGAMVQTPHIPAAWPLRGAGASTSLKSEWEVDNILMHLHEQCASTIKQLAASGGGAGGGGAGTGGLFGGGLFGGGGGGLFGGGAAGGGLFGAPQPQQQQQQQKPPLRNDVEAWRRLAAACHDYRCLYAILSGACAPSCDGPPDEGLTGSLPPQWTLRRLRDLAKGTCLAAYVWDGGGESLGESLARGASFSPGSRVGVGTTGAASDAAVGNASSQQTDDGTLMLHLLAAWLRHPGYTFDLSPSTGKPLPFANEAGAVGVGGPLYLDARKVPSRVTPLRFSALLPRYPACRLPAGARVLVCPPRRDHGLPSFSVLFGEPASGADVGHYGGDKLMKSAADGLGEVACRGHAGAFHAAILLIASARAEGRGMIGSLHVNGPELRLSGVLS